MKSISDNGNTSFVLNGVPTRFEMLSLRNGYVGLAGANQVRSGQYEYLEPSPFTFRVPGGSLNGITLEVSPMPKFKVGEEVLVYLYKQGNTWKVTRGSLGKVKL